MKKKAFTLIELLIVVAIIGILAAIAVPNFLNAQIRANIARVQSDQKSYGQAMEMYRIDCNDYPYIDLIRWGSNPLECRWKALTTPVSYINGFPQDPFGDKDTPQGLSWVVQTNGSWKYRTYDIWIAKPGLGSWDWLSIAIAAVPLPSDTKYYYSSQGPDLVPEADFSSAGLLFNASNGLHSRGDIYFAGPGFITSGKK